MARNEEERRPHFVLNGIGLAQQFVSPKSGRNPYNIPIRDRSMQAAALRGQMQTLYQDIEPDFGLILEFRGFANIAFATESLARDRSGIELLNVRLLDGVTHATVYVPDGKLSHFERLIVDYEEGRQDARGIPRDSRSLIDAIQEIRRATVRALWTDTEDVFPWDPSQVVSWEVWLPVRKARQDVLQRFRELVLAAGGHASAKAVEFPERTVLVCRMTPAQLEASLPLLSIIAELRRAKETADFFDGLPPRDQQEWVEELLQRTQTAMAPIPYICIIDTGVNRGHALLSASLDQPDMHSIDPNWGNADAHGHGTEMAGIALYGDLTDALQSAGPVQLFSKLESAKILNKPGANQGEDYGALTQEAVARVEVTAPRRPRVFNLAVTATDTRDRGRPSSWSASLDALASDWSAEGRTPRLFVVSAGNCYDLKAWLQHPNHLATEGLHDPAQAWNCLTVGSCTEKIFISESDAFSYQPIAMQGSLSPFTSTSVTWTQKGWPLKPDVVLEGGNAGKDGQFASNFASLSLLTTNYVPSNRQFTTTNATSAATALAAGMAARIYAEYPGFWPETIRALMVHSARWTNRMEAEFLVGGTPRLQKKHLLQHCGYGVPDLGRALWSASNSLTLIVQSSLQPFGKVNGTVKTRDMHLHDLPWPREALEALGEMKVQMRVTLSYFIEPNPGARGASDKYAYQSHALRFEVRRPDETTPRFLRRINRLARDEEEGTSTASADSGWAIGDQLRRRGSLHSDVWSGSAAELANRGVLAIYPAVGWWRRRASLGRYDRLARYSLIVSIEAPETNVDLYAVVASKIATEIAVEQ